MRISDLRTAVEASNRLDLAGESAQARDLLAALTTPKTEIALLAKLFLRDRDAFDLYRGQAYALITPEHIDYVINRLNWELFMAAQWPSLTEREEAAGDTRQMTVIAERTERAAALDSRLKEADVQAQVATELLAWAWASWGDSWEGASIADMLERFIPDKESWEAFSETTLELGYLRKILGAPQHVPAQGMRRVYDDDGYGALPSDVITNGTRRAILGGATNLWRPVPGTLRPEMMHRLGKEGGYAHYTIDNAIFPTPEDAFAVVRRYGLGHLDVFHYILQLWLVNRDKDRRGPFDGVYFGIETFLDDRKVARHKNGYHKPENIDDVVSQLRALEHLMVSGTVPQPHKRSKQPPLKISAHIVDITHWVTQPRLDGTEKYLACYVRPGDWAAEMQDMAPQFAITMSSVLQLNNKNQYLSKQIALYILEQFKIRSSYGTFSNPFYVETLLEGACILIDKKNPARFRSRVEAALEDLKTLDPPIIKSWHYVDQMPNGGHGMLTKWLKARVRFLPTPELKKGYATIQEHRQAKIEQNKKRTKPLKIVGERASNSHP